MFIKTLASVVSRLKAPLILLGSPLAQAASVWEVPWILESWLSWVGVPTSSWTGLAKGFVVNWLAG